MSEPTRCRVRILFRVGEAAKYISHLDLLRAWERILRRAGLPLTYSQGFNPHPKIVIAMPLPVGCTGEREIVDVYLDQAVTPASLVAALRPVLPPGISVVSTEQVSLKSAALPSLISRAIYEISLEGVALADAKRCIDELWAQETLEVVFRGRAFDLRPLVGALAVQCKGNGVTIEATLLRSESGRIGRPDVLLEALGLRERARHVCRVQIVFEAPG